MSVVVAIAVDLSVFWIIMEPARKRGRSDMWEHFNLIAPGRCTGCIIM